MPRLCAIFIFYLIPEILSEEISFDSTLSSENHTIPHRLSGFFQNARKCCPYASAYSPTKRVCLYSRSSGNESSKWKQFGDSVGSRRIYGTPNCGEDDVLVDYELVVKVHFEEEEAWESGEENIAAKNCEENECDGPPRVRRNVSVESEDVEDFFQENSNHSSVKDLERTDRVKVLSALVVGGMDSEEFAPDESRKSPVISLLPDGTLRIGEWSYEPNKFCIDGRDGLENSFNLTVRVCEPSNMWCNERRVCVRKCCPDGEIKLEKDVEVVRNGEIITVKKRRCAPSTMGFHIPKELSGGSPVGLYNGNPCGARQKYVLRPENRNDDKWYLKANGTLLVPKIHPMFFPHTENCLDMVYSPNAKMDGLYAYLCFPESIPDKSDTSESVDRVVYPGALLISCFFLAATLAVYALLPTLRNLHGLTLISHACCLLAAFICLASAKLTNAMSREDIGCKILGYSILFTFLAALSWLNVMCFDIWWTFGGFRGRGGVRPGQRGGSGKSSNGLRGNMQRYILYSIYAWMIPLIITALTALADKYGKGILPYDPPGIGAKKCWFEDDGKLAVIIHFVVPSTILMAADVIMFALTAVRCWRIKAEIHKMQCSDKDDARKEVEGPRMFGKRWWKQKYQADKERMVMNLKLCAAMGVNWSLEIASWWLSRGEETRSDRLLPMATWYATDVANCLHGIFVFVVFVGKKKIMRLLWKRLKDLCSCCQKKVAWQSTRNGSQQDSSNLSSIHGTGERLYNFSNGKEMKTSRLKEWFIRCGICSKPSKNHKRKDRYLSKSITTTTSISGETSQGRISYTP